MLKIPAQFEVNEMLNGTVGCLTIDGCGFDGWTMVEVLSKLNGLGFAEFGRSYEAIPGQASLTISGFLDMVEVVEMSQDDWKKILE